MYLVDTNVWVELFLEQEQYKTAKKFLSKTPQEDLYITIFSVHSIGIILTRKRDSGAFDDFVNDVIIDSNVKTIYLSPNDYHKIPKIMNKFGLDFDDAYQYVAAEKYKLKIVSFDADFDKTKLGRMTPKDALAKKK